MASVLLERGDPGRENAVLVDFQRHGAGLPQRG